MSTKQTVDQLVVMPATVLANVDGGLYVANQMEILAAASAAAAALIAQGRPEGVVVAAVVPVIQGIVLAFPPQLLAATIVAEAPFS